MRPKSGLTRTIDKQGKLLLENLLLSVYYSSMSNITSNTNVTNVTVGPIQTNCWIYPISGSDSTCAVIDPGAEPDKIIAVLNKLALTPVFILLTHGHYDHIEAVPMLINTFKGPDCPKIAIHNLDSEYIGPGAQQTHKRLFTLAGGGSLFKADYKDFPPADILLEEGTNIGPFTVLHIPGHTRGSIAFWDKEAKNLFTGDTMFKGDYGRTDLAGGNEQHIFESLKRLFSMDPEIKVFPGHGPATTIGWNAENLVL
jgi:glyoxylase-like metal-dependent hydrolase (beta-lactamase superfamily II)